MVLIDHRRLPYDRLSASASNAVADLVVLLADGYSGELRIQCQDGGIRLMVDQRGRKGDELGTMASKYLAESG